MSENKELDAMAEQFLKRQNNPGGQIPAPEVQTHAEPNVGLGQFKQNDSIPQTQQMSPATPAAPTVEYQPVARPMTEEEFAAMQAQQVPPQQPVGQMGWPKFTEAQDGTLVSQPQFKADGGITPSAYGLVPRPPVEQTPPVQPQAPVVDEFAEETIVTGTGEPSTGSAPADDLDQEVIVLGEDAMKAIDGMEKSARERFIQTAVPEVQAYQKDLVLSQGYTPQEAMQAARSRAHRMALEELKKYQEEHPNGAIITIDKEAASTVEFTPAERAKMQTARALKLVTVESIELESLQIIPMKEKVEMSHIRSICGSLAQYSAPMLSLGDYMTFRGAQSGFLASCVISEDDTMLDAIEKKASILYSCFDGGVLTSRFKQDKPDETISYEDFCNIFHYEDLDLGMYCVVTASAMEETESSYRCPNERCGHLYPIKYNQKTLLDLSEIPEVFKQRVQRIDENRANLEGMRAIHEECMKATLLKSPLTQNVYQVGSNTIAQTRRIIAPNQRLINVSTAVDLVLLLYIQKIWVYDSSQGAYLPPIDVIQDPVLAFSTICSIHQVDVEMLSKFIHDTRYTPKFRIHTKCPRCGRDEIDDLDVDEMVFLYARGTSTEIHQ